MPVSKDEKLTNALLYAIEEFPDIGKTRLMKFVFFVDLITYNETGNTLLEDEYKKMTWGPVPDKSFGLTSFPNKYFDVTEEQLTPEKKRFNFPLKMHSNRNYFSDNEILMFNRILRLFKKMSAEEISEFTHQFTLWKNVDDQETIPLNLFNLDDYEYFQFMSLFAYDEANELSREIAPLFESCEIKIEGYQIVETVVKLSGNSGRVYVPIDWVGKKVNVVLIEPLNE
jgi:putative transposon-encoded protein/uncharacterized phage-associated protein